VNKQIKIDKPFIKLDSKDYLLDHLTGDFYRFFDKKWNPFINTGLHCRKAAEEDEFGIYVSCNTQFRVQPVEPREQIYLSTGTEQICYIKQRFLKHWALKDAKQRIKVLVPNIWDIHDFNFVNPWWTF
jgi:hypothetical protein